MRNWLKLLLLMFFVFLHTPADAAPDASACLTCHAAMQGTVEKDKGVLVNLHIDQEKYSQSVHGAFDCVECHMAFSKQPHQPATAKVDRSVAELAAAISVKSKVDPVAQAACIKCHEDIYKEYSASVHGNNVMVKKSEDGPVCTSCHGSPHEIQPKTTPQSMVNHFNVVKTCGTCHEEEIMTEKYKFTPYVMKRYLEGFHGKKYALGHPGAPSCASCHGAHGVKSQKDPASPIVGDNKIKTCAKCHSGATPKFVASFTHQPLHPIAHYTEMGLIILTLSVFTFIIVHVVLDLYSEIRDRLFRKGGSHE